MTYFTIVEQLSQSLDYVGKSSVCWLFIAIWSKFRFKSSFKTVLFAKPYPPKDSLQVLRPDILFLMIGEPLRLFQYIVKRYVQMT